MRGNPDDRPKELHTEADNVPPLSAREAMAMGWQTPRMVFGRRIPGEIVYGETDGFENEDQYDAHHADRDQHF